MAFAISEKSADLNVTVRFAVPLSDLSLKIPDAHFTSTLNLKRILRENLPASYTSNRLRLIYAGRILQDDASLLASINPNGGAPIGGGYYVSTDRKGKAPLRDGSSIPDVSAKIVYIHCSIGDVLSEEDLDGEATAASDARLRLKSPSISDSRGDVQSSGSAAHNTNDGVHNNSTTSTTVAPRGFDRLASAGLTAEDITSLRRTFLAHLSHTHTPDTMPQGSTLLVLEDRWLDNAHPGLGTAGGSGIAAFDEDDESSSLDDLWWGNLIGFFWPIGAIVWGFREEGVWTRRRQVAVLTGILTNLVFGFARWSS